MPNCPECQSANVIRNGQIHDGTPKFACKACGRQFFEKPHKRWIAQETKALIDTLLERVSLAGIVRMTGVSARWLQDYVNRKYSDVPKQVDVPVQKTMVNPGM
jgi:insertion element IS1 protein InsB